MNYDDDYDDEAWGNTKKSRAKKFNSKKRTRHEGQRLQTPRKKNRRKIPVLENLDDYDDYDDLDDY